MKTSELIGNALDWAVAKCEGYLDLQPMEYWFSPAGIKHFIDMRNAEGHGVHWTHSSTDWAEGGPIIEREDISFRKYHRPDSEAHGKYYARICRESGTLVGWHKTTGHQMTGQTPLIAAMRCYVASKLGDDVDIPEELK